MTRVRVGTRNPSVQTENHGTGSCIDAASQSEVDAGTVTDKYVSPKTLSDWPGGGGTEATLAEALAGTGSTQMMSPRRVRQVTQKVFNIEAYGAIADDLTYADGAVTGTAFTSSLATFTSADAGKAIKVAGAGVAGAELLTTIAAFVSTHAVTLNVAASISVSGKSFSYGTDNTTAAQSAIAAIKAAGGGVLYVPVGSYAFAGPFVTSDSMGLNPNAMIYIPAPTVSSASNILNGYTIIIRGESNYFVPITGGTFNGSVLHCYRNQGTGTRPSFIGGTGQTSDIGISAMNYANVIFENLTVLHSSNGGVTPTNMITVNGLDIATIIPDKLNIQPDCSIYSSTMTNPLGVGGIGYVGSRKDNNGSNTVKNLWVSGGLYEYGAVFGEHTYLNGVNVSGTYNGIAFLNGNFNIVGNIVTNFCVNHIVFPNATFLGESAGSAFVNLDWEFETSGLGTPPAWLTFTQFILDVGQNGRGKIRYNYQDGNETFTNLTGNSTNYGLITVPLTRPEIFLRSIASGYIFDYPVSSTLFKLPVSSAPASPVDGDVWREDNTNTGLKIRINGITKTISVT